MSIVGERWGAAGQRTLPAEAPEHLEQIALADLTKLDTDLDRDTHRALRAAARNLTHDFAATCDTEAIEHLLFSRYVQLARHARITKFLPLLAERFVRDRLRVLATRTLGPSADNGGGSIGRQVD